MATMTSIAMPQQEVGCGTSSFNQAEEAPSAPLGLVSGDASPLTCSQAELGSLMNAIQAFTS